MLPLLGYVCVSVCVFACFRVRVRLHGVTGFVVVGLSYPDRLVDTGCVVVRGFIRCAVNP